MGSPGLSDEELLLAERQALISWLLGRGLDVTDTGFGMGEALAGYEVGGRLIDVTLKILEDDEPEPDYEPEYVPPAERYDHDHEGHPDDI